MTSVPIVTADPVGLWEHPRQAFLTEKQRRSGSRRTVEGYAGMLCQFFAATGQLPHQVTSQHVFSWVHGKGRSGRVPTSATVSARIACLSSFYRFLIRMELVTANPCDRLERPRATPPTPRGLTATEVHHLLSVVPDSREGWRDRAIILTLVLTGRRRAEVLGLRCGDLDKEGDTVFYRYRGKGGKLGRRELPAPAYAAMVRALAAWEMRLDEMAATAPLWPSRSGKGLGAGTFYARLQCYLAAAGLPASGVHVFRHTAAKLRRDAGQSVEDISQFLDHSNLAVTSVYLQRLEGQRDRGWEQVAGAVGL